MGIVTERRDDVLFVRIDRPETRNALDLAMNRELAEVWRTLRDDPALRVGVVTGTGDKAFCAGADLKEIGAWYASMSASERLAHGRDNPGLGGITRNLDARKPVIAAINGACLAGGLELALACDIRVAAEGATFGLPEVRWGLMPGAGGTQRLPRAIPMSIAMEMILTAQPIDARRALSAGLVSAVVTRDELEGSAMELASRIAANAPLAVQAARFATLRGRDLALEDGLELEQLYADPLRETEDVKEGLAAFAEKRPPRYRGR